MGGGALVGEWEEMEQCEMGEGGVELKRERGLKNREWGILRGGGDEGGEGGRRRRGGWGSEGKESEGERGGRISVGGVEEGGGGITVVLVYIARDLRNDFIENSCSV